jgi:uridine kinase
MIIGIAGGSCSGKTTILKELRARLGDDMATLSFDEYFVGTAKLEGKEIDDWESPSLYNYQDFIADLKQLKAGKPITITPNSRESSKAGIRQLAISPHRYTIVEGFLIFHSPEARELFNKRIFIELPEDEIIRRRLARAEGTSRWDSPDYINNRLIPGHKRYVEPQKESADLIVDGLQSPHKIADQIIAFIER